jgi:hypothetical protein
MAFRMNQLFKLQFLGPLLFIATLSAELAARALEYAPSSDLLCVQQSPIVGDFPAKLCR